MGMIRAFFGLGESKAEQIANLEKRLRNESALLDLMAFRDPAAYRKVCMDRYGSYHFRPGVAWIEYSFSGCLTSHEMEGK